MRVQAAFLALVLCLLPGVRAQAAPYMTAAGPIGTVSNTAAWTVKMPSAAPVAGDYAVLFFTGQGRVGCSSFPTGWTGWVGVNSDQSTQCAAYKKLTGTETPSSDVSVAVSAPWAGNAMSFITYWRGVPSTGTIADLGGNGSIGGAFSATGGTDPVTSTGPGETAVVLFGMVEAAGSCAGGVVNAAALSGFTTDYTVNGTGTCAAMGSVREAPIAQGATIGAGSFALDKAMWWASFTIAWKWDGTSTGTSTTGTASTGGGSGGTTTAVVDWSKWPGDASVFINNPAAVPLLNEMTSIQNDLKNFTCSNGQNLVSSISDIGNTVTQIASFVSGLFGGGQDVAVLLKILQNGHDQLKTSKEQICRLMEGNQHLADIKSLLMTPKSIVGIFLNTALADPKTAGAASQWYTAVSSFASTVGSDDLVTAQNKANVLALAKAQADMALFDRLVTPNQPAWAQRGGPLITQSDVDASGGALKFTEGDYTQNFNGVVGGAAAIHAKGNRETDVAPADAEASSTCIPSIPAPPSTGDVQEALAKVKWNARQKLASSQIGAALCKVIDHPARTVNEICFTGMDIVFGGKTYVQGSDWCIYGPKAPAPANTVFTVLPSFLMALAVVGGVKLFI